MIPRSRAFWLCFPIALLAWVACSPYEINIKTEPHANLDNLKTYAWMDPMVQTGSPDKPVKPEVAEDIVEAVNWTLSGKGYHMAVGTDKPDFLVGTLGSSQEKVDASNLKYYQSADFMGLTYKLGTLIIAMADPATNKPLWRGSAQAQLDEANTPEKLKIRINEAVNAILQKFPSKSSKF